MKTIFRLLILAAPFFLSACTDGSVRDTFGLNKDAPDEFTIVSHPPLSLPPEFNLRPPEPGAPPRQPTTNETARGLITGKPVQSAAEAPVLETPSVETAVTPVIATDAPTGGTASLLKRAGADAAQDDIRTKLGADANAPVDTSKAQSLYEKLTGADKTEPVVDPKKEAERLRTNKDTGQPVTNGDVPVEDDKPKSVIDRVF